MTPKFKDYLTSHMRKYMSIVVITTTVFFMILSISGAQAYTHIRLKRDNQSVKTVLEDDYKSILSKIEEIELIDINIEGYSEKVIKKMYNLRSTSKTKFNFTVIDDKSNVIASNLYSDNRTILLNSEELKSALRQMKILDEKKIVDNPITGYNQYQQSIMTMVIKTDQYYYIIEPLLESFVELDHTISSNIVISDRYDNTLFDNTRGFSNSINKVEIDNSDYMIITDQFELYTLRTVKEKILPVTIIVYTVMVIITTLLVLLQLLKPLSNRLVKPLDVPLEELLQAIEENRDGNLDYFIESHHFTEFDKIYTEFNELMRSTKTLMTHNEELLENKRIIEIKHLKNQFNPHFIFNALESIRYEVNFNPNNASNMILALGRLMQYSIQNTDSLVTVKEDIKYIEDYLVLQKMRFKDRLQYTIDIEESLLEQKIPKLIIQPIIENSIKHNMEKVNNLNVYIRGNSIENNIYFVVEDNGVGLNKQYIDELNESLIKKELREENLGLYNINKTIKLIYGDHYGIALENDYGLRVIVNLPKEGDKND